MAETAQSDVHALYWRYLHLAVLAPEQSNVAHCEELARVCQALADVTPAGEMRDYWARAARAYELY